MRAYALFLLAFALVFRAAPLCAEPVAASSVAAMSDCIGMSGEKEDKHRPASQDASLACHNCIAPPAQSVALDISACWLAEMPVIEPAARLAGSMIEPPTPPPRIERVTLNSTFQRI